MSQVDEIKERLSIVDLVSEYVKLEKAGRNYKGLSPFTKEKTPSFFVSPDKGMYYCFSSNKGGDIFTFVEEMEGVDFFGALQILADKAGVTLRKENPKKRNEKERLYDILESATHFYQKQFASDTKTFRYMVGRGIKTDTLKIFRVGYAPDSWDSLLRELKRQGFGEEEIENAGLIIKRADRDGYYDRFRSRIMFPICDTAGRVVGFSGRIFGKDEKESGGKYVNTPETLLYHKSRVLYGFDKAKDTIRAEDACIMVEGQMDVLASHEAGIKNVVAVSGTSLTIPHLKFILRFTKNILLSLDADSAGLRAADRSAKMALSLGMNVSAVTILGGKDPADIVSSDPKLWKDSVKATQGYIDFRIEKIKEVEGKDDPASMIKETIFPHVFAIMGGIKKDRALQKIGVATSASLDAVREEYETWRKSYREDEERKDDPEETIMPECNDPFFSGNARKDVLRRRIFGSILWQESLETPLFDTAEIKSGYLALVPEEETRMMKQLANDEKQKLSFEAEVLYSGSEYPEKEVSELLVFFEIEVLNETLEKILREIRKKENDKGSEKETEKLLKEYQTLLSRKEQVKRSLPS